MIHEFQSEIDATMAAIRQAKISLLLQEHMATGTLSTVKKNVLHKLMRELEMGLFGEVGMLQAHFNQLVGITKNNLSGVQRKIAETTNKIVLKSKEIEGNNRKIKDLEKLILDNQVELDALNSELLKLQQAENQLKYSLSELETKAVKTA